MDLKHWFNFQLLLEGKEWWENRRLGPSVPPIKTEKGWLIIYHGVSESGYRVGRVLLDLKDPSKVIARSSEPILEPQEKYETEGNVKNVVFPSGGVVLDHTLYLVYGGADKVCCLAFAGLPDLLRA